MMSTHILRAPIGTPLWARLREDERIVLDKNHQIYGNLHGANTNIVPHRMTRAELFAGYLRLVERLSEWRNFELRLKSFISGITYQPDISAKKRPVSWSFIFGFIKYLLFSVDRETRRTTLRIMRHTRRYAPFMMKRVLGLIGLQYSRLDMLRSVRQALLERIKLEESADFKLEIDRSNSIIPDKFKKPYQQIFPEISRRVYTDLADKTVAEETLIKVFIDFITRWGQTTDSFTDQHRASISDLVDRIITMQNSLPKSASSSLTSGDETFSNIKNTELAEEVLKAVEQELRSNPALSVEERK